MKELKSGLIISCQAQSHEPLYGLGLMKYFARCAVAGGAVGIRALAEEIPDIRTEVDVPIIGLVKRSYPDSEVYITPTFREIDEVIASGADVIALDVTGRAYPGGVTVEKLVGYAREKAPGVPLMADTDCMENALLADALGFDYVGTTMRGYTPKTKGIRIPDVEYLCELAGKLKHAKLIAEGGIWERDELRRVLRAKPYAVVIGTAVTRPADITRRFAAVMEEEK